MGQNKYLIISRYIVIVQDIENCTYLFYTLLSNSITFSKLPQLTDNYEVFVSLVVTIMCLIDTTMMVCIICICNLWRTLFGKNMYLTEKRFAAMCVKL